MPAGSAQYRQRYATVNQSELLGGGINAGLDDDVVDGGEGDDIAAGLDQRVIDAGTDVSQGSELAFWQASTKDRMRVDIIAWAEGTLVRLAQHGTSFIAANALWPALDLSAIGRPLKDVLGEALKRPFGKPWQNFDRATDDEFVQRLDEFGGTVADQPRGLRGSEGALFLGSEDTVALKRCSLSQWFSQGNPQGRAIVIRTADSLAPAGTFSADSVRPLITALRERPGFDALVDFVEVILPDGSVVRWPL